MNSKIKKVGIIIFLITFIITITSCTQRDEKKDLLAKCLTEKGAKFYGSFQCPHCAEQKKIFASSIEFVDYIECGPLSGPQSKICSINNIEKYPTWIINDTKYLGVRELEDLSALTNCPF